MKKPAANPPVLGDHSPLCALLQQNSLAALAIEHGLGISEVFLEFPEYWRARSIAKASHQQARGRKSDSSGQPALS